MESHSLDAVSVVNTPHQHIQLATVHNLSMPHKSATVLVVLRGTRLHCHSNHYNSDGSAEPDRTSAFASMKIGYALARTRSHSYIHNYQYMERACRSHCQYRYWVSLNPCDGVKANWDFDCVCFELVGDLGGRIDFGRGMGLKNRNTVQERCGETWSRIVVADHAALPVQSLAAGLTSHRSPEKERALWTTEAACSEVLAMLRQATDDPMVYRETWRQFRYGGARE
jgi:hypothetical protein